MLIYDTRVVVRWEKQRCEDQSTDSRAETFYNRMLGEIYMTAIRGKMIHDTQVCDSGHACSNMFKSEGHSVKDIRG